MKRLRFALATAVLLAMRGSSGADLNGLVPVRWPGGPVEVARRAASGKQVSPELASALERWYQPWSLDQLRDTPFNCIVVPWSGTSDAALEREQQRIVRGYAAEAHRRGIAVTALISAAGPPSRAMADAADAGLDGVVLDGASPIGAKPAAIVLPKAATAPGIRVFSEGDAVQATPTSEPWIDFNSWLVGLLRAWGAEPAWLGYTLEAPSAIDYTRAIADAAAAGGHWIVAPDDALLAGLAAGKPEAKRLWRRIADVSRFFEEHAAWREFAPVGPLGIFQEESDTAQENFNLIARRKIPYRVLSRAALSGPGLAGFSAVLATGCRLSEAEKAALSKFAEGGGLVIVGPGWGGSVAKNKDVEVRQFGKGRIAVYENEPDSESLSKDVLHYMGKDNLGIRLFHASSVLPVVRESGDGRQLLIEMVNYATQPADAVMIRVAGEYRGAQLYSLDHAPAALELEKSEASIELKVPTVPVYAAVVLER